MIAEASTVRPLVERFAEECAKEYSLSKDRSKDIVAYIMGESVQMPDLMAKSNHYSYRLLDQLEKLGKRVESDIFFRAGAVVIRSEAPYRSQYSPFSPFFLLSLGEQLIPFGMGGRSRLGEKRMDHLAERLEKMRQYTGDDKLWDEITKGIAVLGIIANHRVTMYNALTTLLLLQLIHRVAPEVVAETISQLPTLMQAVLLEDEQQVADLLQEQVYELLTGSLPQKDNPSALDLHKEFIEKRRAAVLEADFSGKVTGNSKSISRDVLQDNLFALHAAILYRMNLLGGKQELLASEKAMDTLLLTASRQLHEVYPLEVREQLLSMDKRTSSRDALLEGIVPNDEPYAMLEQLRVELEGHATSWHELRLAVQTSPEQALRVCELTTYPFTRLYVRQILHEIGNSKAAEQLPDVETLVYELLRDKRHGGKYGLMWARYLQGELSLAEFWGDKPNQLMFDNRNRDRKRRHLILATAYLPPQSQGYRRFVKLIEEKEMNSTRIFMDLYAGDSFSAVPMLQAFEGDSEIGLDRLLDALLVLREPQFLIASKMPEREYRRLVQLYPAHVLRHYKTLVADTRLLILSSLLSEAAHGDSVPRIDGKLLLEFVRAGLVDSAKKVRSLALAKLNQAIAQQDSVFLLQLYRGEKKQAVKELVLHGIYSLPESKTLYEELLKQEKSSALRAIIQVLLHHVGKHPAEAHAAIADLADAKALNRLKWAKINDLPALHGVSGEPLDMRIGHYIMLQSLEHTSDPNERLNELRAYVSQESLAQFAHGLLVQWIEQEAPAQEKWVMYTSALLGDRRIVEVLSRLIVDLTDNSRGAIAAEAVRALSYVKEPSALMAIDKLMRGIKNRRVKTAAEEALTLAAETQGLTPDQLADRLVTTLGFDHAGELELSYGERAFTIKVSRDLQMVVINAETGKTMKSLPAAGAKDDAEAVAKAKAQFNQLKKDLKTMVSLQAQRLEESLSKQRLWLVEEWRDLFVNNVIMQKFAIGLIWGAYRGGVLEATFRYMEDGTFNTVNEEEYSLPEAAAIGLVHPLELDQETITAWTEQLADYEIQQPLEQLARQIFVLQDGEGKGKELDRLPDGAYSPTGFPKTLEKYGWYKGQAMDGGMYSEMYKEYGDLIVELYFSGTSIVYYEGMEDITLDSVHFYPNKRDKYHDYHVGQALQLEKVPARIYSETLYDILRAAGR